jgi:hypothetical protein
MPETISVLKTKYGSYDAIPNAELYESLCLPITRADLVKLGAVYNEWIEKFNSAEDKKENGQKVTKAEQQEHFSKRASAALEDFKTHPFIASVRLRTQTSLPWIACYLTWETNPFSDGQSITENKINEQSHAPILDFFVKKDPNKKLREQDSIKKRLLLWPRNGCKSTIDIVDATQWILNFPAVRILYFTGDDDLAIKFVRETKGHFLINKSEPTLMNLFFPEFCFEEAKIGNQFEFNCPVWADKCLLRGEPTVQASSVGSGLGGRHYDVVKADDAVYDRNTASSELCQNVSHKIRLTISHGKMLMHSGYLDVVGTRYHEDDYYGDLIEKNVGDLKVTSGLQVDSPPRPWTLTENQTLKQKILIAEGIRVKTEVAARLEKEAKEVTYINAGIDGCDLLLPTIMSYSWLMGSYADDERTFESQINQNPRSLSHTTFDRVLLLRSTVNFSEAPFNGPVSQTWDFAGPFNAEKKGDRDFCTASAGIWNEKGTCFIQEVVRKRFKPADLAKAVVEFAKKYHPFIIGIEDTGGAKFLEETIKAEALKSGDQHVIEVCRKIDWIPQDNRKGSKNLRMSAMHPWLVDGRLKFLNHCMAACGGMDVLYNEFERCLHGGKHNDIPDVISYQVSGRVDKPSYSTRILNMVLKPEISGKAFLANPIQAEWNMLFENGDAFGRPGMGGPPMPIVAPEPEPVPNNDFYPGVVSVIGGGF